MATILPPSDDASRRNAPNATNNEQRTRQRRGESAEPSTPHREPTPEKVMAEAAAMYPDTSPDPPTPEQIAAEAYAIYLGRGGEDGRDLEDWLEAERLLKRGRTPQVENT